MKRGQTTLRRHYEKPKYQEVKVEGQRFELVLGKAHRRHRDASRGPAATVPKHGPVMISASYYAEPRPRQFGHKKKGRRPRPVGGTINYELDKAIIKALGGRSDGSGFYFPKRIRDIDRTFKSPAAAQAAVLRLRKLKGVTVKIWPELPLVEGLHIYLWPLAKGERIRRGRR